jgi:hypothetical protein
VLLRFFNSINLLEALAKVKEIAAVTRKALLGVIRLSDYKLITFMLSKDI